MSIFLKKEFGKGYSEHNLLHIRKFALIYQKYEPAVQKLKVGEFAFKLSWIHYIQLIRIKDVNKQSFYAIEAIQIKM